MNVEHLQFLLQLCFYLTDCSHQELIRPNNHDGWTPAANQTFHSFF